MTTALTLVVLFVLPASTFLASGVDGARGGDSSPAPIAATGHTEALPLPTGRGQETPASGDSTAFYLQQDVSVAAFGIATGAPNFLTSAVSVSLTLPSSTPSSVGMGFELNALSNTGDWYQVMVDYNWPGCASGITDSYEWFNDLGASVNQVCSGLSSGPSAGDSVTLFAYFDPPTLVCMEVRDNSYFANTNTQCVTQPDAGATGFVAFSGPSNKNGFFTGPMTELVDPSAKSCERYTGLPSVSYYWGVGDAGDVAEDVMSSAEFELDTTTNQVLQTCYSNTDGLQLVGPDPLTTFFEGSEGASEGPHWEAVQNSSAAGGTPFWRFETDTPPAFSLDNTVYVEPTNTQWGPSSDSGEVDLGQEYDVSVSWGGTPCYWLVGTTPYYSGGACSWIGITASTGSTEILGYYFDPIDNAYGAFGELTVLPDPSLVLTESASTSAEGVPVTFTATAEGGSGVYNDVVKWSGLPPPCQQDTANPEVCIPDGYGTFTITATQEDSFGYTAEASEPLTLSIPNPCAKPAFLCYPVTFRAVGPTTAGFQVGVFCLPCHFVEALPPANDSAPPLWNYSLPDGTYGYILVGPAGYGVENLPPVGNFTVNGSARAFVVDLVPKFTGTLAFSRSGLPAGTRWCVTVGWSTCTTLGRLSLAGLTPGRYPYDVEPLGGYNESARTSAGEVPREGWVTVSERGARISVTFSPIRYLLTFDESGLASGKGWSVRLTWRLDGRLRSETGRSRSIQISFLLPNGTYNFTCGKVRGYLASPAGAVAISGGPSSAQIVFTRT